MNQIYASATTSASHIYGNVSKAIEMYIKEHLPGGLIKETVVSTNLAFRGFRKWRNKKRDWGLMGNPYMIIRPVYSPLDSDAFLENTLYTRHEGSEVHNTLYAMQTFLEDEERNYKLGFKINRNRIEFEVSIVFKTLYMMMDTYHYLKNMLRWDIVGYVPTHLESLIPRGILRQAGNLIGIDINKEENISTFIKYLRTHSTYPITYKMRNSTSNDEYFLLYKQNILTTFSDLSMDEGNRKNMVDDSYTLSFKVTCDFNIMGTYLMVGTNSVYNKVAFSIGNDIASDDISLGSFTPIYTYDLAVASDDIIARGYKPLLTNMIKTDPALNGKDETIGIAYFFDDDFKIIMRNMIAQELDPRILAECKIYKDRDEQITNADFTADWTNMSITIKDTDKYATYRLVIYVNLAYLNNRITELHADTMHGDQQNLTGGSVNGYDVR